MCDAQRSPISLESQPLRILIVEDDQTSGYLLKALLGRSSLCISAIEVVDRLGNAMKYLEENDCDLTLLDLNLPDSSGVATLTTVVQTRPHLAVVVVTGEYDESLATEILAHGAQDYLVKGQYSVEGLLKTIRYALGRKTAVNAMRTSEN